jgi:hypothetical protein
MAISKHEAPQPALPKEAVEFPPVGGEVIVRGLMLSERLWLENMRRRRAQPGEGEDAEDAQARAGAEFVPRVLAMTVIDAGGAPIYTEQQWSIFGGQDIGGAMLLFNVAMRLSGYDVASAAKNS